MLLQLFHITYCHKETTIIINIHLEFQNQGLVLITGSSGSGKSTLLQLIGGVIKPTQGEVLFEGKSLYYQNKEQLRKEYISFVFQGFHLIESMSVLDNLKLFGFKKEKIKEMLKQVKMDPFEHQIVGDLSGGQKQRIAMARALLFNPRILLVDEPTSSLDVENSQLIKELLIKQAKKSLVIVVSHDEKLFIHEASRHIVIEEGSVSKDHQNKQLLYPSPHYPNIHEFDIKRMFRYIQLDLLSKKGKMLCNFIAQMISIWVLLFIFSCYGGINRYQNHLIETSMNQNTLDIHKVDGPMSLFNEEDTSKIKALPGVKEVKIKKESLVIQSSQSDIRLSKFPEHASTKFVGNAPQNENEVVISYDLAKKIDPSLNTIINTPYGLEKNNEAFEYTIVGYTLDQLNQKTIYYHSSLIQGDLVYEDLQVLEVTFDNYSSLKEGVKELEKDYSYQMDNMLYAYENNLKDTKYMIVNVLLLFCFFTLVINAILAYEIHFASFLQKRKEIVTFHIFGIRHVELFMIYLVETLLFLCVSMSVAILSGIGILLGMDRIVSQYIGWSMDHFLVVPTHETLLGFDWMGGPYFIIILTMLVVNIISLSISLYRIFKKDEGMILREDDLC